MLSTTANRDQRRAASLARARARLDRTFDPEVGLIGQKSGDTTRHVIAASTDYARCLLVDDNPSSWEIAGRVIRRVLEAQEIRPGHPHRGGFRFGLEDAEVTGLNVASFVLQRLAAIWHTTRDRLPADLVDDLPSRARLALEQLDRLSVHPRYTNAALMDCANAILWGEILDDEHVLEAGRRRLDRWIDFTGAGAPFEYNSPSYLATDLVVLAGLASMTADPAVRAKALTAEARLWLHGLLHYHAPTGRQAGPHCRAYHAPMHGAPQGFAALLWQELGVEVVIAQSPYLDRVGEPGDAWLALTDFHCPDHLVRLIDAQSSAFPASVRERVGGSDDADLCTYLTREYALGTASRTYTIGQRGFFIEHQANYCILHYRHDGATGEEGHDEEAVPDARGGPSSVGRVDGWRTLYTRFVTNERYFGTIAQQAIRSASTNFYDQGLFAGHQHRNVAIALYGLELGEQALHSVEALVVMPGPVRPAAIYAGDEQVPIPSPGESRPVPDDSWVLVRDGAVWIGIWPLARDSMGVPEQLELRTLPTGELVLAMPHFRSTEPKWFWEYESDEAAFYTRNIRSGFLIVVGEASRFPDRESFAAHLAQATIADALSPAGIRTVDYRDAETHLRIDYDLVRNRTVARFVDGAPLDVPMLESPWAAATRDGLARVGGATLHADGPAVLLALDDESAIGDRSKHPSQSAQVWQALALGSAVQAIKLETPVGTVTCSAFGTGTILVEAPAGVAGPSAIQIRAASLGASLHLPPRPKGLPSYRVIVDDADVTDRVVWSADGGELSPDRIPKAGAS